MSASPPTPRAARDDAASLPSGAALAAAVRGLARDLARAAPAPVAVLADNGPRLALLELAARAARRPWLPLPGFFSDEQLAALLARCRPGTLLTDDPARLDALLPRDTRRAPPLAGLTRRDAATPRAFPGVDVLTCTSGSTGDPAVVLHAAHTLDTVARSLARVTALRPTDRHLAVLPLAVLLESVGGLHRCLVAGATLLLPPLAELGVSGSSGFDPEALDAAVRRHDATSLILMPAQLAAWTAHLEAARAAAPAGLRFVGVGGAPGPVTVLERARALGLPVSEGYGLSEAGSVVCLDSARAAPAGSVGPPLPHLRLRLSDAGELQVRGAACLGLLDRPAPFTDDGWLATGDLAERDDAGRWWIRGRKDLRFATAWGRNLSPEWLERRLLELPGVAQAVVFGAGLPGPVALLGPRPRGWSDAERAALPAALEALARTLPDYARPRAVLPLPAALDAASGLWTATGRPRRAALWARFGDELTARAATAAPPPTPSPHPAPLP